MNKLMFFPIIFGLIGISCSEKSNNYEESGIENSQVSTETLPQIAFFQEDDALTYPDAILELYTPLGNQIFKPGKVPFEFNIKNFSLEKNGLGKPSLFMILNGSDPVGYNAPIFQRELSQGTYRTVAYLVDENGRILKNFGNYLDRDFQVGDSRPFPYSAEPYLALHQPINSQIIALGEELIIDFLVLGGDMKLDGLKVRVMVNDLTFETDEMTTIRLANLPSGDYQIKVQLLRNTDKELEGPFSSISKTVFVR
jgi:hypothetical protein